jgi:hypothetical protein
LMNNKNEQTTRRHWQVPKAHSNEAPITNKKTQQGDVIEQQEHITQQWGANKQQEHITTKCRQKQERTTKKKKD